MKDFRCTSFTEALITCDDAPFRSREGVQHIVWQRKMTAGCLKTLCSLGSFLTYLMRFLSEINTTLKVRRNQVALQSKFSFLMSLSTSTDTLIMAAGIPQSSFEVSSSHSLLIYSEGLVTTTDH